MEINNFEEPIKTNILNWLNGPLDETTKTEILKLLKENPQELKEAFLHNLSFGTAGARGLMGVGINRFNIYTIRAMTQGLANYLIKQKINKPVVIGFDNRNNSNLFAKEAARVLSGNNIKTFLFKELRPSPIVSFTCRYKKCAAAIMITASHNPPKYNGFKVYWQDGAQIIPPHDKGIIEEVKKITNWQDIKLSELNSKLIIYLNEEMDNAYLKSLETLKTNKQQKELKIVYTNLHGTGITMIPKALNNWGFSEIFFVEEQKTTDGNFPNAPIPNPEDPQALQLGLKLLQEKKADLLIATDPDADRIAIAIQHDEKQYIFNGNQIACLLFNYILQYSTRKKNDAIIKSIVTTELLKEMAKQNNIACFNVLTGFKYIAELMEKWQQDKSYQFLLGAEESYGYLVEDFVRDKDSISAACFLSSYAEIAKKENKNLLDILHEIYKKYGLYQEDLLSLKFDDTKEGYDKMNSIMQTLRTTPPKTIANIAITSIEDYKTQNTSLPKTDMLIFNLSDMSKIIIRPSGTEPKMKIYLNTVEKNFTTIDEGITICQNKLKILKNTLKAML